MKAARTEAIVIFALAIAVRILIFYPSFIQGGDLGQFSTFVREIYLSGGSVPSTNSLYFPGTQYIYPPFLFMLVYWTGIPLHAGYNAIAVLREMLFISAGASALTASIIYSISRSSVSRARNLVIGLVAVFFTPDLYALSWGGDPFVFSELLLVSALGILLYRKASSWWWVPASSVFLVLIAVSHDLTWFFAMLVMLALLVYDITRRNRNVLVAKELIPTIAGLVAGSIWWLPRLSFVLNALLSTQASGYGFYDTAGSALPFILVFIPFAVGVVAIAGFALFPLRRQLTRVQWDPYIVALVSSLVFIPFMLKSPTVGGRIMYYTIILGTIVSLRLFGRNEKYVEESSHAVNAHPAPASSGVVSRTNRKYLVIALIFLLIATVPFQVENASGSVAHYKTGYYQYDPALIKWGEANFTNGTVIAPNIGNYISSVDGAPVIIYGNYLVGGKQISQRHAAMQVLLFPGASNTTAYIHEFNIKYLVLPVSAFNNSQTSSILHENSFVKVYGDSHYVVEKYTG